MAVVPFLIGKQIWIKFGLVFLYSVIFYKMIGRRCFLSQKLVLYLVADLLFPGTGCEELGIVEKPITTNPRVMGAIGRKEFRLFWRDVLKAPKDVMQIVEYGYKIPFKSFPPPKSVLSNNKSALSEPEFVCDTLSA
jgi:hypothetical protein